MKPYKSLTISNEVLKGILDSCDLFTADGCKLMYHSFYSGGTSPDGLCGYIVHGEYKSNYVTVTFYGTNNEPTTIHIFVRTNKKSTVRNQLFASSSDAVGFIVKRLNDFVKKGTKKSDASK